MLQHRFILFVSLVHQSIICSNVNKILASSSQESLTTDVSIINANAWKNFTELFVDDKNGFKFFPKNTTFLNNNKNETDDEVWDLDRFLEIWNPIAVSRIWNNETYRNISLSCSEDLTRYMMGVSERRIWAQKSKHNLRLISQILKNFIFIYM